MLHTVQVYSRSPRKLMSETLVLIATSTDLMTFLLLCCALSRQAMT